MKTSNVRMNKPYHFNNLIVKVIEVIKNKTRKVNTQGGISTGLKSEQRKFLLDNGEFVTADKLDEINVNEHIARKCLIARYDETITEPPYLTISIDNVEVLQPINDYLGEKFYSILQRACSNKGYTLKFYTMSSEEGIDYEIVVE